ncbi:MULTISPECIES: recombinase family protein [unclassified Rhizobium]|uniref:recombinase family protein n=1 Tax=unclassified Rhizobium TaxID=2613769 RepID=UPI0013871268|nr:MULTISPECIES: recombinase family protein [unclassified Rhizobium]
MAIKAYSYVRISTPEQRKGRGEERQLDAAREYAAKHGLNLDESHIDPGKSGFHGDHVKSGALGVFLDLVARGKIAVGSYLLVENLDRLSRQAPIDAQAQFIAILQAGIKIVTLMDGQVYERGRDFTQMIVSLTIMSRGHEESARKSYNSKKNHDANRRDMLAGLPRFQSGCVGWIDQTRIEGTKDCKFSLNAHAKSVQRIFELADQGVGPLSIARILNESNTPPLKAIGTKWWENTVARILKNETAIGTLQVHDTVNGKLVPMGDPLPNYYPGAVSEELFWRVQRNKPKAAKAGRKGLSYANLFQTITRCEHCGGGLGLVRSTTSEYQYYRCKRRYQDANCPGPSALFPYTALEAAVLDNVSEFYLDSDLSRKAGSTPRDELLAAISVISEKLANLEKARKNTLAMSQAVEEDEDRAELVLALRELRPQIDQARAELSERQSELREIDDKQSEAVDVVDMIRKERALWVSGSPEEVFLSRSRVAQAIRNFVHDICVDFHAQTVRIQVGGATKSYDFDRTGKLINVWHCKSDTDAMREVVEFFYPADRVDGIMAAHEKVKASNS